MSDELTVWIRQLFADAGLTGMGQAQSVEHVATISGEDNGH